MTAMEAVLEEIRQSPKLKSYVDELGEVLRREAKTRKRFRDSLHEDVRAEFINGKVVVQMPARLRHTTTVRNVGTLLDTHVRLRKLGRVQTEQALTEFPRNDYGPDICFWKKDKSKDFEPDQLIFPVPDFVCEVLSPSAAAVDRGVKFIDYEANRVGEYWIIDPQRQMIEQWVLRGDRYEMVGRIESGTIRSHVIKGFKMPVAAAFDDAENLACLKRMLKA